MPDMNQKTDSSADRSAATPNSLTIEGLSFRWQKGHPELHYPDLHLKAGLHIFLQGPSGSGKSTLLSLLAGLMTPTSGKLEVLGQDMSQLTRGQKDRYRADHLGVIFQQFNLVPYLSTLDNVLLPCRLSKSRRSKATPAPETEAITLLGGLGLDESLWRRPVTGLSVGQQQRVAAARALIGAPGLILADEPTSALDSNNRDRFIELLLEFAERQQSSVVFVSHDQSLADRFDQQLSLETTP